MVLNRLSDGRTDIYIYIYKGEIGTVEINGGN